jgi:hypothetical protein
MEKIGEIVANGRQRIVLAANHELRFVPLTWQHPVDETGAPVPLGSREFMETEDELQELLAQGYTRDELTCGYMPDIATVPAHELGVAVYETTTEGTPITPTFPNTREGLYELLHYCTRHCATFADSQAGIDGWARILGLEHVLEGRVAS